MKKDLLLGDFELSFSPFQVPTFQTLSDRERREKVNRHLLEQIQKAPTPCFLLPAVSKYCEDVRSSGALESYALSHFELWLNQFSGVSGEENYAIRGKIMGKFVPRDTYQSLFPVGMGKSYAGSHYVTAHSSPDLDTTIASFWGWVDAFAARVAEGLHLWNVPGGAPETSVEMGMLFHRYFGKEVIRSLAKTRTTLSLLGIDLITQKGMIRQKTDAQTLDVDQERTQSAVVLVDEEGNYLGDWRSFDVEGVRAVIMHLNQCLRYLETNLHAQLISLFAKEPLSASDVSAFAKRVLSKKMGDAHPAADLTAKQRVHVQDYMVKVLNVPHGLECSLEEFAGAMKKLSLHAFFAFVEKVQALAQSDLFDGSGKLIERRPQIFLTLEKLIHALDEAIREVRRYVDRLDVAFKVKTDVFGHASHRVTHRADVEEIRSKMGNYPYLTVTTADEKGKEIPLGIIHSGDLHKNILGTVTLRDFCNREETKIPAYFEVISVIDHHKSSLHTSSAAQVLISDAQSSNVLCAELAFVINDLFSSGGMRTEKIREQIDALMDKMADPSAKRLLQRLLQRALNAENKTPFFIDPRREFLEYLQFLYGILDDTDLLTKVTHRDVECVCQLLSRLKSLMLQQEVEVVSLSDIPRDSHFAQKSAARLLQHPDLYSLYSQIYSAKESAIDAHIQKEPGALFTDTKEQNGCARVGQTKLFPRNYPLFSKHAADVRAYWYERSTQFWKGREEVDLYLHMISTVPGAEALYKGDVGEYTHTDEMWIWIPFSEQSIAHLKGFLSAFSQVPQVKKNLLSVEFIGEKGKDYEQIFNESSCPLPSKHVDTKSTRSFAVIRYKAGSLNSRKALISPYLPKPVSP
ncbi:MAG: hypothetical protein JSS61_01885 [Verrucomicrobia bacterium]|nr:hypothetical protein [Verrucomicrobiota bacterium]